MDKTEIKKKLHAYDPALGDLDDPSFSEALKVAGNDPELTEWLEAEQAFDRTFSEALRSIESPGQNHGDLIDRMNRLAAQSSAEADSSPEEEQVSGKKIISFPFSGFWKRTLPVAAAAGLLMACSVLIFLNHQKSIRGEIELAYKNNFVKAVALHTNSFYRLQYRNENVNELKAWLTSNDYPHVDEIPALLENMKGIGCMTFTYENRVISKTCFKGDKIYHLYVANRCDFPDCPELALPAFFDLPKNQSSAAWSDEKNFYLLSVEGKKEDLDRFL